MKRLELLYKFKEIIREHISEDELPLLEDFNEQIDLKEDLLIDSLDVVNIIIDIENEFSIEIGDDEIKKLTDVGSCLDLVEVSINAVIEE